MAYATQVTISTGNKVSLNYQSQEVSVTLTYQLEREDADVLAIVKEKTAELAEAHRSAWQILRDAKVSAVNGATTLPSSPEVKTPEGQAIIPQKETNEPPEMQQSETTDATISIAGITPGQLAVSCYF
jgi:hypothetical protein